jgi:hypothetical protein
MGVSEEVKLDEATAGDFLLGLGAAGGLLALKKGWDRFGKGSKLARGLSFTKKGKAKVDQDKVDKAKEKEAQKTSKADADALKYEKDEEGIIIKPGDADKYKKTAGKAPTGWQTDKETGKLIRKESKVPEKTMTITESNELQAIMALDDEGISAEINRKGQVVVKKKDLKKAEKALKKSFKKGGEPKLVGEDSEIDEMKMSAALKKKKDKWAKSSAGKASLKKSAKRAKKVASGSIKIDKAKGRAMAKARARGGIRNEFELDEVFNVGKMSDKKLKDFIGQFDPDERMGMAAAMQLKAAKKEARKRGIKEDSEIDEALKPKDKLTVDTFYYRKSRESNLLSTNGNKLEKLGMGGQTIAKWNKSGKIEILAVTDVKSTESILTYMKKSIPKGNFDPKSYKLFFGEELQRTAYEVVSEARKKAIANKPKWEQE